ncbi:hypothetical protein CTAYLR_002374 [Chrysophaeum taylorii]|uniref:Uncharacterized protein n=1 Tax=Chrysophaeum taylorii TaxID=2483200 RepID=A0AAD7XNA4_9STRA|nr:hypothetical protein CTAYLR_002374 [Chrysophaeum taylorii]
MQRRRRRLAAAAGGCSNDALWQKLLASSLLWLRCAAWWARPLVVQGRQQSYNATRGNVSSIFEFKLTSKINYNGLGNQFWDHAAGTSIYRLADAARSYRGKTFSKRQLIAPFAHHWRLPGAGTSWGLLFDISDVPEVATFDELFLLRDVPIYSSLSCDDVRKLLARHQICQDECETLACETLTAEAACDRNGTFAWLDVNTLPCKPIVVGAATRSHFLIHPFASPHFHDPHKHRHCEGPSCGVADDHPLPFNPESPSTNPALADVLRRVKFNGDVVQLARRILEPFNSEVAAIHVRRGDRQKPAWVAHYAKNFHLFNQSCASCDACRYHCVPTDDDIRRVWRNFSQGLRVCWLASDDASLDALLLHDLDDAPGGHHHHHHHRVFIGRRSRFVRGIIEDHLLRRVPRTIDRARYEEILDLYILTHAKEAIFDLYSTFSAIAYRKRDAMGRPIMFW